MVLEHFSWSRVFDTQPGSSAAHDVLPPSVQSKCCPGPGGVAPTPAAPNIRRPAAAMLTASAFMESPLVGWLTTVGGEQVPCRSAMHAFTARGATAVTVR